MPLNDEVVLDIKYLPEEDVLALVAKSGSVSIFDLNSSLVPTIIFKQSHQLIHLLYSIFMNL